MDNFKIIRLELLVSTKENDKESAAWMIQERWEEPDMGTQQRTGHDKE